MKEKNNSDVSGILAPCYYFISPGPQNTEKTLEIAAMRAKEIDCNTIVLSSSTGASGIKALDFFPGENLVVVTHSTGFIKPDFQQFGPEQRNKLEKAGAKILTCQHSLGGVGRAVRKKLGTYQVEEIMAFTLRIFGAGIKVAVEIALMAADAGLILTEKPCIAMGGTNTGLDTAVLLKPAHAQNFFDMRILETLAKPHLL